MVTFDDFIKEKYNLKKTWPFKPVGTLINPSRQPKSSGIYSQKMKEEQEYLTIFTNTFVQSRMAYMTWILSAFIGIIGNFVINFYFSLPLGAELNNVIFIFGLFFIIVMVLIGTKYIESPKFLFSFIPDYYDFPPNYNTYINHDQLSNIKSRIIVQFDISDLVINYSNLILMIILRDHLKEITEKVKYLRISDVDILSYGSIAATIKIETNFRAMVSPIPREELVKEFMQVLVAFMKCRTLCNVLAFETDTSEWQKHGASFIDLIVDWDIEKGINDLKTELESILT